MCNILLVVVTVVWLCHLGLFLEEISSGLSIHITYVRIDLIENIYINFYSSETHTFINQTGYNSIEMRIYYGYRDRIDVLETLLTSKRETAVDHWCGRDSPDEATYLQHPMIQAN